MFNRAAGFNRMEFNTTSNSDVYLYGELAADSYTSSEFNALFHLSSDLPGNGEIDARNIRIIETSINAEADGIITAEVRRIIWLKSALAVGSGLTARTKKYRLELIDFMGVIEPGDVLVIDMRKLTCTVNGAHALHLIDLDQFNLRPGENDLTYEDDSGSRTLQLKVAFRERWL